MDKLTSRKLILTVLLIIGMGAMNFLGHVDSSDFVNFVQWSLGIYVFGNVGSKFSHKG